MGGIRWNLDKWAESAAGTKGSAGAERMTRLLLAIAPQSELPAQAKPADWARQLVLDPAYQLK